jgi:ubiquinone/menaquinone biosynthesis C-methylase UbiE/glycosyltransferase involved in cell wall biosynthesis
MLLELESTGERFLPKWGGQSELEHVHRYLFACSICTGKIVLDIASGEGYGSKMLSDRAKEVIGVDISSQAVSYARERYQSKNLRYLQGSCSDIPLLDFSVDVVVSFETIEHHDQHEQMMREIKRVLRPGGLLVISSPDKRNYSEIPGLINEFHVKELYEQEFKQLINNYFSNVEYLAQRVILGSCIFAETVQGPLTSYVKEHENIQQANGISRPLFWLAVASDKSLPVLLSGVFENSVNEADTLKLVLADRDAYISHLNQALTERDGQIVSMNQALTERDGQIASVNHALTERDGQIVSMNHALTVRDGQIASVNHALTERDGQIASVNHALTELDGQIVSMNHALTVRDGQIASLNHALTVRDGQIASVNHALTERDGQIASVNHALTDRDFTIKAFKQSTSWKITGPLRAISSFFKRGNRVECKENLHAAIAMPGANAFFTICSKNFLAHARTLYGSVRPHYPTARFFVVLCDRVDGLFDPEQEPFEFVFLEDLNLPNLDEMAKRYNITEFNTAVKPFAFTHLMTKFNFGSVVYLDPDLFFVDKMEELDRLLNDGAEAVLTPHILQSAEHDEIHDGKMLLFGIYNLGFLALRNTPAVLAYLRWWGRRLERDCVIRLEEGLFVDQKWADLLPAFVPGTRIIHSPGYNVAYWNLPQRKIVRQDGRWSANGEPLRFVHFSGNKLDDVHVFSRHSQQVTIGNIGDLRELLDTYREQVYQQGHAFYRTLPYAYSWDGEAGVNLHTPKELDRSPVENKLASAGSVVPATAPEIQLIVHSGIRRRVAMLRQAMPLAKQLSGGWVPFVRRTWRAYRVHGWHHVKAKAVELSRYRRPPPSPHSSPEIEKLGPPPKRLLYLDWGIPKPDQDAASVTAKLLMEIVDSLGYRVTFIPTSLKYEEGYYEGLIAANIEVIVYPAIHSPTDWLTVNAANFDICILARGPVVWPYLATLKKAAPNLRLIFYTVDLHYLRELRQAELANDQKARTAALIMRDHEFELIEKCDLTILLSQEEMYTVREINPAASVALLPVVFSDIPGAIKPFADRRDILFIGSFPHQPNIDAVLYFAEFVFPIVRQRIPDISFKVIGSNPPESVQGLAQSPGIEILGFIKDLEPVFSSIRLSVAPLRYGAGIKGKIGTSLCYGVPCVATPIAVEGMGLTNDKNVLIGETPEQLADAICGAYLDPSKWGLLSREGHRFALENYSISVIRDRVSNMLSATTEGWRPIQSAVELDGWDAYQKHRARLEKEFGRRVLLEQSLLPTDNSESFKTSGFCCVCGKSTNFLTSFMYSTGPTPDGRPMPNWREHMQCQHCGLVNRMRAALNALHTSAHPNATSRIYITERLTQTYSWLERRYATLQGSEYFGPEHKPGSIVEGIRHEDVMNLSFKDNSFDFVLSFDVLEHVPFPDKAFKEIYRALDENGFFIFSVPFSSSSQTDIIRASLRNDGMIEHHLPAEYHGNPVDPEGGALCFRYFGWEMLEQMKIIGFKDVRCLAYWSEQQGYLGNEQYLFIGKKVSQ